MMRWPVLVILALVLLGCGGPKGLSRSARLDHGHYRFGALEPDAGGSGGHTTPTRHSDPAVRLDSALNVMEEYAAADPMPVARTTNRAVRSTEPAPLVWGTPVEFDRSEPTAIARNDGPPERTTWNLFALAAPVLFILALVIAIPLQSTELLLIGCAIAFVAALIGARQCRDRGQRGQGFALAVIGFSVALVLMATIALLLRLGK